MNQALAQGLRQAAQQQQLPLRLETFEVSDGGEGFLTMAAQHAGTQSMPPIRVAGPNTGTVNVPWAKKGAQAFLESAHVIGHACVPNSGDPLHYSSYGLGALFRLITQKHPEIQAIYVGLGSSAIVDGGMGALAALGANFYDIQGQQLPPQLSSLPQLHAISAPQHPLPTIHWVADVNNTISGARSGLRVYGPQKGLTGPQIEALTSQMHNWWKTLWENRPALSVPFEDWQQTPHSGAAGGVGMGVSAFYNSHWHSGSHWCIKHLGLRQHISSAAGLIIGEGCFDRGSLEGKITGSLLTLASELRTPVIGVFGQVDPVVKKKHLWEKQAYADHSHAFQPEKQGTRQWLMERGDDLLAAFEYAFEGRNVLKDIEQNKYK